MLASRIDALLGHSPRRILVFRALVLGDMLCAIPAIRALRSAYPDAHISLVGLPWATEFAARFNHYFDDFFDFPGFPGLPERPFDATRFPAFLSDIQRRRFDVALQLHGSGSFVNPLTAMFNARCPAGYYLPGDYCPDEETFMPYPDSEPEVRRHVRLMEFLGIPSAGEELELPVTDRDRNELHQLHETRLLDTTPYVCIHPGARYLSRRWPADRFARVGDLLAGAGYTVVITGSAAERELAASVSRAMDRPHLNFAGRTTLGTMAALIEGAQLVLSNDTGISHVAAALKTPSVVIVTGSDPQRWAPLDHQRHSLVMQPVECRPCEHVVCPIDFRCADRVAVEQVAERAFDMLARYVQPAAVMA